MKDALISQMAREARDEMALDLGAQLQLGRLASLHTLGNEAQAKTQTF